MGSIPHHGHNSTGKCPAACCTQVLQAQHISLTLNIFIGLCSLQEELTSVWSISTRQSVIKLQSQPVIYKSPHAAHETRMIPLSSRINPRKYSFFHVPSSTETSCHVTSTSNLQLTLPAIPLATSSIITYSHDTLAITGARPLIEDH